MGNHKSKPTGTIHLRTTPEAGRANIHNGANLADSTAGELAPDQNNLGITTDSNASVEKETGETVTPIESTRAATPTELRLATSIPDSSPVSSRPSADPAFADSKTKMEIATEIFTRMKKIKGTSRKEIIHQFVLDAKLSKAGASTYYQLIRAKLEQA